MALNDETARITFEIAKPELRRVMWRRVVTRSRYLQSIGLFLLLALAALLVGGAWTSAGCLLLLYALVRPFVMWDVVTRAINRSITLDGPRTVEYGPAGLVASGSDWKTEVPWRHFKGWSEDATYFFLDTTESGVASVIPKQAMNGAQQDLMRRYLATIARPGVAINK
jgi:hypothetical protein